jgi:hypothetical protein
MRTSLPCRGIEDAPQEDHSSLAIFGWEVIYLVFGVPMVMCMMRDILLADEQVPTNSGLAPSLACDIPVTRLTLGISFLGRIREGYSHWL